MEKSFASLGNAQQQRRQLLQAVGCLGSACPTTAVPWPRRCTGTSCSSPSPSPNQPLPAATGAAPEGQSWSGALGAAASTAAGQASPPAPVQQAASPASSPPSSSPPNSSGSNKPETAVRSYINTNGSPVECRNTSRPFTIGEEGPHGARSVFNPTQLQSQDAAELAKLICGNATTDAAVAEAYRLFSAAGGLARTAALAYKQADCNKQLALVVDGVNEAAGARAASVQEQAGYLLNQVEALDDVGAPACFALLVANQDGTLVTSESFFFTSG
ncbi:hypothetical protein N2152v2_010924 [Parachlorella kessleri]